LVSWRGDTWPDLACTLAWTSSRCRDKQKELSQGGFPREAHLAGQGWLLHTS
jgi:hypothetical protein